MRRYIGLVCFVAAVFIYVGSLFTGPRVPDVQQTERCVRNIQLPGGLGTSLNCDSGSFIRLAHDPRLLLERERVVGGQILTPGALEQTSPALTVTVWLVSQPFRLVFSLFQDTARTLEGGIKRGFEESYRQQGLTRTLDESVPDFIQLVPTYAAFILTHAMVLVLAFALFCSVIGRSIFALETYEAPGTWIGMFVFTNTVTKQFFFSPHSQLFHVLAPLVALWFARRVLEGEAPSRAYLVGALMSGIGMLFYNVFVVSAAVMGCALLARTARDQGPGREFVRKTLILVPVSILLFALPFLIWWAGLQISGRELFIYDIESQQGFYSFRQDLPITDVANIFLLNMAELLAFALRYGWALVILVVGVAALGHSAFLRGLMLPTGLYVAFHLMFFAAYGIIESRMTVGALVACLPVLALATDGVRLDRRLALKAVAAVMLVHAVVLSLQFAPYGEKRLLWPAAASGRVISRV